MLNPDDLTEGATDVSAPVQTYRFLVGRCA